MKGRLLTRREHLLLLAAFAALAGTGWAALSLKESRRGIVDLRARAAGAAAAVASLRLPPEPAGDPDRMEEEAAGMREEARLLAGEVEALEAGFADLSRPGLSEELQVRLSRLAGECGVEVLENAPVPAAEVADLALLGGGEGRGGPGTLARLACGSPWTRPVRRIHMRASFGDLRSFVDRLGEVPGRLVPVRFEIAGEPPGSAPGGRPAVQATLVVVVL